MGRLAVAPQSGICCLMEGGVVGTENLALEELDLGFWRLFEDAAASGLALKATAEAEVGKPEVSILWELSSGKEGTRGLLSDSMREWLLSTGVWGAIVFLPEEARKTL
ncbi:hypothetical protein MLD38_034678 [Melastoma candidum]|uniref:Uncharacterized protein n=1 Tax=Melastoma candidum TaxID=119954 RepID=A0ACB9MB82_9MYRT|nr:hypothetical protein MLD38_034678 [Melastoma candidum]